MIEKNTVKQAARLSLLSVACLFATVSLPLAQAETPRINLQNTDVRSLVEVVSRLTGKNFVIDPSVGKSPITFVSGKGLSEAEFYEAFLSILQVHGFEAIEAGNIIKIVPMGKARSQVAPIYESDPTKPLPQVDVDETITQVFKLQYIPVATAVQTLTPLAGQGETRIQFNQSSNSVIVTGRGQNVARLAEVIRSIDQPNNNDFELVGLKYSVASQLAQTLKDFIQAYRQKNLNQSHLDWLVQQFEKYPSLWECQDQLKQDAQEIVQTVESYYQAKQELAEAHHRGYEDGDWLAKKIAIWENA